MVVLLLFFFGGGQCCYKILLQMSFSVLMTTLAVSGDEKPVLWRRVPRGSVRPHVKKVGGFLDFNIPSAAWGNPLVGSWILIFHQLHGVTHWLALGF